MLAIRSGSLCLAAVLFTLVSGQQCVGPWTPDDGTPGGEDDAFALFNEVWDTFDQEYSYFLVKDIDWDDVWLRHADNFDEELTPDEFASRLAEMLSELSDWHVNVQKPDGSYLQVVNDVIEQNYTSVPRNRYVVGAYDTLGDDVIWHGLLERNIAYIRVDTFDTEAWTGITDEDIASMFELYADTIGMIVDVRPNSGGNETNAMRIASHFVNEEVVYGYTATRNGPEHDDFSPAATKLLQPGSGTHYSRPTACLIGERCMSSCEWFVLMMDQAGAFLIGETTRGASGNPVTHTLSNGVRYSVSTWVAYTPTFDEIEDVGIAPDLLIRAQDSFDAEHDYVIERALDYLEAQGS